MRVLLLIKQTAIELRKHLHPRAVLLTRVGAKTVKQEVLANVKERLDVTQKMLEYDMFPETFGDVAEAPQRDILKDISDHFGSHMDVEGSVVIQLSPSKASVRR